MSKERNVYNGDNIQEDNEQDNVKYECFQCKDDDIIFNVQARWNKATQEFVVVQTEEPINAERCDECGDEWEQLAVRRIDHYDY